MHNVTERDGVFTVREPAWWDLDGSHVLADYPTREQAQKIAHDWEPVTEPLYRRIPEVNEDGSLSERYEQVPDWQAMVRSDTSTTLGVVTTAYEPVTNSEMYDIAEAIQGEGEEVRFETGGSLMGGKKVWLLLRLNEPIVLNGDPHGETIAYYALQNSHDGTLAFRGQGVNTRIVCDNTSRASDYEAQARGTEFVFKHTANVRDRIEEAKQALAGWRSSIVEYRRVSEVLLDARVTVPQVGEFIRAFIPMPPPHAASSVVEDNVRDARQALLAILKSPTCEGISRTGYGLVQAAIEYNSHVRKARSAETRFRRAYLDRSQVTADAVTIVRGLVGV